MLIRRAEVAGRRADVRIDGDRIAAVAPRLDPLRAERVVDAGGGALLPGLHDHHLHLLALAAAWESVACGPPAVRSRDALARALRRAPVRGGWIRGVGYHESVAGPLGRDALDALRPDVPVRVQHRSGACWSLNGAALATLGLSRAPLPGPEEAGVERGSGGLPTGRVFRLDGWLRRKLGPPPLPDLALVGRRLARAGITGATDATPSNGPDELALFERARADGALPQRLLLMGRADLPAPRSDAVARGPVKLLLDERALPGLDELCGRVRAARAAGRGVAIHCVTRAELLLAVAALADAGARGGDRIEHASVAPPEAAARLADLGLTVVTQPHFVCERGDDYLREVEADDRPWLYRGAGLLSAGVRLGGGTDAPFGAPDPWAAMRAAVDRTTRGGRKLAPEEALPPERALALFTTPAGDPGGAPRRVAPGAAADLVLLDRPWARARELLDASCVAATFCAGREIR